MLCFGRDKLMQHTNQYQFNLIESGDTFSPQPLNENAEKMEQALAEQALALSSQIKFKVGTYTGTGTLGSTGKTVIKFPFDPKFVLIWGSTAFIGLFAKDGTTRILYGNSSNQPGVTWGTKSLSFWTSVSDASYQLNAEGCSYSWLAIG